MNRPESTSHLPRSLLWLALGTFAVGTEGFVIAGLLPLIATDFGVVVATAGQLVIGFALTYAVASPILATLTAHRGRRLLLAGAMSGVAAANLLAAMAPGFESLLGARIFLALTAAVYTPAANALAGTLVAPEQRGRALAVVNGGLATAIALGVPLGAVVGNTLGWRTVFLAIAVLAVTAAVGLALGLRGQPASLTGPAIGLKERLATARQPAVLRVLALLLVWATGAYAVYTYIAPFLAAEAGLTGRSIGIALVVFGVSGVIGTSLGGVAIDHFGSDRVLTGTLVAQTVILAGLSIIAYALRPAASAIPVLVAIAAWGITAWSFYPAQQSRLLAAAGPEAAPIAFSINSSFLYIGISAGAVVGSLTLRFGTAADIGWVGACFVVLSLGLVIATRRMSERSATTPSRAPSMHRAAAEGH